MSLASPSSPSSPSSPWRSLAEQSVEEQFKSFDLNGDGVIEKSELAHVLKELDSTVWTDDRVGLLLETVDLNKDGVIQLEEFFRWVFKANMLYCICGYSCGTRKALDKHIERFADEPSAAKHGVSRRCIARKSKLPVLPPIEQSNDVGVRFNVADAQISLKDRRVPRRLSTLDIKSLDFNSSEGGSPTPLVEPDSPMSVKSCKSTPGHLFRRSDSMSFGARPTCASSGTPVRLLVVRHAQSANTENRRRNGGTPSTDPGLTDLGMEQAKLLGDHLRKDLHGGVWNHSVVVVSSPMRRCLLTISPAVSALGLSSEDCIRHGGAYEFGCAGTSFPGTPQAQVEREFPNFRPLGFTSSGCWDYRGDHPRENEEEVKERIARLAKWLRDELVEEMRNRNTGTNVRTIVFVGHQTVNDLLCQLLVDGTDERWVYSEFVYRLQNAGITELMCWPDGVVSVVTRNMGSHLLSLKFK